MKEFIFYTFEGCTASPTNCTVENIQILGFERGANEKQGRKNLIQNNKWIIESGFAECEIQARQLLDEETKILLKKLIDYNWVEEKKHYEENPNKNHIFLILKKLKSIVN